MKRWRTITALLLILVLASVTACNPFGGDEEEDSQQLVEVARGDLAISVSGSGNIDVSNEVKLTFGTSGRVTEVNIEEGDRVTKGQVLASLDTITIERAVKTAEQAVKTTEIAVRAAEIDLELATNSYQELTTPYPFLTYEFVIPESVDAIRVAQQRIKEAQEEFQKGLKGETYSMGKIQEQLLDAKESLLEAETKLDWGLGSGIRPSGLDYWTLRTAQIQIEKAQLALDSAQNDLDKARNELDKVNDELEKTVIIAPFDGVIAKVNVKSSDSLSAVNYATAVAIEVIDLSRMELNVDVDEIDIPDVKLGQRAIIEVDALPDLQLEGEITSISSLAKEEGSLMLYEVKISFDVPQGYNLKIGMSAIADIVIDERSNVLLVPNRAITQGSQGNPIVKVMVDEETKEIEERPVVLGVSDGFQTEIVDGLNEEDVVVIETKVKSSAPGLF